MDIIKILSSELSVRPHQIEATIKLIDEGNTIPFIARYRKEATGELDDTVLRDLYDRLTYLRSLEQRQNEVIRLIDEQGKLTEEIRESLLKVSTLTEVDDIYRPFRPKRRTRATIAKEKGLEPLATIIYLQDPKLKDIYEKAREFINEALGVANVDEAIAGAKDIIAEMISDNAEYRKTIRDISYNEGVIISKASKSESSVYDMYYDYKEAIKGVAPHRILAMNRGEKEEFLNVKLEIEEDRVLRDIRSDLLRRDAAPTTPLVAEALEDAYKRLIAPSIEREIRNALTEKAEEQAIRIFALNLKNLMLIAPVKDKVVMGFDPAFRTGCKIAVVDATGKLLDTATIYPTEPQNDVEGSKRKLKGFIEKHGVELIALGNGTACRESELFLAELIKEVSTPLHYVVVNEAGASVYSASKLASEEYPDINVSIRGAISIARRLQDPLAELVKIDPKSIGVGQYQHDVNQKRLAEALTGVVEDAVNSVGVDLNTASSALLSYVSGISPALAKGIVAYREEIGKFSSLDQIKGVKRLGDKVFTQCAGFMRIIDGTEILDNTAVHPESYKVANRIIDIAGLTKDELKGKEIKRLIDYLSDIDVSKLAKELEVGVPTLRDIIAELRKPGRDPRDEMEQPIFMSEVVKLEDLKPEMVLKGTVRNVIDFGAFVDIGVHQDGLVHISEISNKFIKHPSDVLSVGDIVTVKVKDVDVKKKRISLTIKGV